MNEDNKVRAFFVIGTNQNGYSFANYMFTENGQAITVRHLLEDEGWENVKFIKEYVGFKIKKNTVQYDADVILYQNI